MPYFRYLCTLSLFRPFSEIGSDSFEQTYRRIHTYTNSQINKIYDFYHLKFFSIPLFAKSIQIGKMCEIFYFPSIPSANSIDDYLNVFGDDVIYMLYETNFSNQTRINYRFTMEVLGRGALHEKATKDETKVRSYHYR